MLGTPLEGVRGRRIACAPVRLTFGAAAFFSTFEIEPLQLGDRARIGLGRTSGPQEQDKILLHLPVTDRPATFY